MQNKSLDLEKLIPQQLLQVDIHITANLKFKVQYHQILHQKSVNIQFPNLYHMKTIFQLSLLSINNQNHILYLFLVFNNHQYQNFVSLLKRDLKIYTCK